MTHGIGDSVTHVDDDGKYEEEAPDNSTTDDEDDHTDRETSRYKLRSCAGRESERRCHRRRRTPRSRLSTTTKTPTITKNAAKRQTSRPASTKPRDNSEDELEPWFDCMKKTTRKTEDLQVANRIKS